MIASIFTNVRAVPRTRPEVTIDSMLSKCCPIDISASVFVNPDRYRFYGFKCVMGE